MRAMLERFRRNRLTPEPSDGDALAALLGHRLRSYRDFAAESAAQRRP